MKTLIIERVLVRAPENIAEFAVATSVPNVLSVRYSLTYEGYVTEWTTKRDEAEATARLLENNPTP